MLLFVIPACFRIYLKKIQQWLFHFLNELDIKTHFEDCINPRVENLSVGNKKYYYTIFDKSGKQVYGDVAVVQFPSNENRVDEIAKQNFPRVADYVLVQWNIYTNKCFVFE